MVQKPIKCCSKKPSYVVVYSVAGSQKSYLVCLSCIEIDCFSKHIIRRDSIENKKNFQNVPCEINDESIDICESIDEQFFQSEHGCE